MNLTKAEKPKTQELLASWVEQFGDELFSWAFYKTSDQMLSEDLVQDTFLAALQSFGKFQKKSSPKTWLFAILNRKIVDFYRKKRKNKLTGLDPWEGQGNSSILDKLFDPYGNWKKEYKPKNWEMEDTPLLDKPEFRQTLQACMYKLPSKWRSIIELKYLEEKEGKDICQHLGLSSTNYWQILHRTKLQLRNCLELNWFN